MIIDKTLRDPDRVARLFEAYGGSYNVAKRLGAHFTSVYRWRREGQIPIKYAIQLIALLEALFPTYALSSEDKQFLAGDPAFAFAHPELGQQQHCACCRYREMDGAMNELAGLLGA